MSQSAPKLNTFQRVRSLEGWHAIAFAATLLERMLPNYALFCSLNETGEPKQYRTCLDLIWQHLEGAKIKINYDVQIDKIEMAIPDAAEYDQFGVYPAIDAGIALAATLQLIKGDDPQGAVVVSKLSQGGVEAAIEASSETELSNDALKAHPLMQWEISLQTEILDQLATHKAEKTFAQSLKAMALAEGISNIGLELTE